MVVAYIVNAIAGKEVDDASPVVSEQFRSQTALVAHIHLKQIEETDPFPIYVLGIMLRSRIIFDLYGCTHFEMSVRHGDGFRRVSYTVGRQRSQRSCAGVEVEGLDNR